MYIIVLKETKQQLVCFNNSYIYICMCVYVRVCARVCACVCACALIITVACTRHVYIHEYYVNIVTIVLVARA